METLTLRPRYFTLQWHLTERCNWHCGHCYQEEEYTKKELPLKGLLAIFKQYLRLIRYFRTLGPERTRLVLAGGEPLLREDLFLFLEKIHQYKKYFFLSMLSNGSLLSNASARRLRLLGVEVFQVSLEGLEKNNDAIRGNGSFAKTLRAIEILTKAKIDVAVSLTLSKANLSDIPGLVRLCEQTGVSQLGIRRLVPMGRARTAKKNLLAPLSLKRFYLDLDKERSRLQRKKSNLKLVGGCDESVFASEVTRPLINCGVTESRILTILPNGEVIACRRLPIRLGNAMDKSLIDIYYNSKKLKQLRNLNNSFSSCRECPYFYGCLSGAKCVSYAYFGKISVPDPQCWQLFKRMPHPGFFQYKRDFIKREQKVHFTLLPYLFRFNDRKSLNKKIKQQ
ncbi:radical SAM protein [Candidatus Omnitrophota bacterium]